MCNFSERYAFHTRYEAEEKFFSRFVCRTFGSAWLAFVCSWPFVWLNLRFRTWNIYVEVCMKKCKKIFGWKWLKYGFTTAMWVESCGKQTETAMASSWVANMWKCWNSWMQSFVFGKTGSFIDTGGLYVHMMCMQMWNNGFSCNLAQLVQRTWTLWMEIIQWHYKVYTWIRLI